MTNIILAAGQHLRWSGQRAKQLVPIAGEILLERTQRQAGNCIVATHVPAIQRRAQRYMVSQRRRWIVETALGTASLWGPRTNLLLGDVCFSDELMDAILGCDKPIAIYGRKWEIFAVSFNRDAQPEVSVALNAARLDAENGQGRGKMWQFYWSLVGLPLDAMELESDTFVVVDDYTNDFDTIEEYSAFLEAEPWAAVGNPPNPLGAICTA